MTATGNNYAEALFILAREENNVEGFFDGLKIVDSVVKENSEYLQFLSTPSIPKSERTQALAAAFEGKIHEHVLSFLQLLCEHGKADSFFECVNEFERLRELANSTVVATVKTAVELSDIQKEKLVNSLEKRTGKTVLLKCVIEPTLLGGIAIDLDGESIDGSVKNNLKHVREVISE